MSDQRKVHTAISAIRTAYAVFMDASLIKAQRIGDLQESLAALDRAVSRLQVLAMLHPSLTGVDDIPRGAETDEDVANQALLNAALDLATKIPATPAPVTITATPLHDGSPEDNVRQWLDGRTLTARPDGAEGYVLDLSGLASFIADTFLPRPIDDVPPMNPDSPSQRALRDAFGPREENQ